MQHFMIPCDFGGRKAPFPIYVGEPKPDSHPLHHQSWWLNSERGGSIPQEVMDSFEKLHKIALENNVSFEELCVYAMGEALGAQNQDGAQNVAPPPPPPDEPVAPPQLEQLQPEQAATQWSEPDNTNSGLFEEAPLPPANPKQEG